jgi:hypothetical protein
MSHGTSHRARAVSFVFAVLIAVPATVFANHSWGNYHWARSSNPVNLKVGDNCNAAWDGYLDLAIDDWNDAAELNLTKVAGGTRPKTCKGTTGRIEVCNERYGRNGWLGLAQIWVSGSHITQAVAKMNDTYFNSAPYNTAPWRRLVMCQEVAHDFGLAHQDEKFDNVNLGSCMDYTNDPDGGAGGAVNNDPSNEHPNAHDYNQLATIYGGHLDSAAAIGAARTDPRGAAILDQLDLNNPATWGRLVAATKGGGIEVYELDLGGGKKHITVVTWTIETAATRRGQQGGDDH